MFDARRPNFLAVDNVVAVAVLYGRRPEAQRVGAAGRFGNAERLQSQFAGGDSRQVFLFLFVRTMPQHGAHSVHLRVAGSPVTAGPLYFLHDDGRRRNA